MKRFAVLLVVFVLSVVVIGAVSADAAPYLTIQNGDSISVTASENPQIVLQFGNRGSHTLENTFIRCGGLNGVSAAYSAPAYTHGAFDRFSIAVNGSNIRFLANNHPADGRDIAPGQNRNVQFTVDLRAVEPGDHVYVSCNLIVLTGNPDDGYAQTIVASDSLKIVVR